MENIMAAASKSEADFISRQERGICAAWDSTIQTGIQDDELDIIRKVSVNDMPDDFIEGSFDTGWFYEIWQHLSQLWSKGS